MFCGIHHSSPNGQHGLFSASGGCETKSLLPTPIQSHVQQPITVWSCAGPLQATGSCKVPTRPHLSDAAHLLSHLGLECTMLAQDSKHWSSRIMTGESGGTAPFSALRITLIYLVHFSFSRLNLGKRKIGHILTSSPGGSDTANAGEQLT